MNLIIVIEILKMISVYEFMRIQRNGKNFNERKPMNKTCTTLKNQFKSL